MVNFSCLQEISYLASSTSKLPYTTAFSTVTNSRHNQNFSQPNNIMHEVQSDPDLLARDIRDDSKYIPRRQLQRRVEENVTNTIPQQEATTQPDHIASLKNHPNISNGSSQAKLAEDNSAPSDVSEMEVPDNVDEVAMLNNVINIAKERKQRDQAGQDGENHKGLTEEEQLVSIGYKTISSVECSD
jgi:hypothetical protein